MNKRKFLSERDKELQKLADTYKDVRSGKRSVYFDAEDLADLADWYGVNRHIDIALEVVDYGLRLHPGDTSLLIEQAYLYLDNDDVKTAQALADRLDPSLDETKILQASILMQIDMQPEAIRLLDKLKDKEEVEIMISVAYLLNDYNQTKLALKWLTPGLGKYEDEEEFLGVLSDAYYGERMLEKALDVYNRLIDMDPYSAAYWYGLARCYLEMKQYDKAIEACDYALVIAPDFAEIYMIKGNAYFSLGNDEKTLENFREAVRLGALSHFFLDSYVGLTKCSHKQWEQAIPYLSNAIEHFEDDGTSSLSALYANLALCYYFVGKEDQSRSCWEEAYKANPSDAFAYLLEARMYVDKKNLDHAYDCWRYAVRYAPYADTWFEIGCTCVEYYLLGNARAAFCKVKELDPDFPLINEKLAMIYFLLDDMPNFKIYNALCANPITLKEMEGIHRILEESEGNEGIVKALDELARALKL